MPKFCYLFAMCSLLSFLVAPAADCEEFRGKWWHYYQRGIGYSRENKLDEALSDLKKAASMRDKDQRMARTYGMHFIDYFPHREVGIVCLAKGDLDAAIRELESSVRSAESAKGVYYLNAARKAKLSRSDKKAAATVKVAFTSPSQPQVTRARSIAVRAEVTSDAFVSRVLVNGVDFPVEEARPRITVVQQVSLDDNPGEIRIEAHDLAGSKAVAALPVRVKREGPSVSIFSVSHERRGRKTYARLSGEVSDTLGIRSIRVAGQQLSPSGAQSYPLDLLFERGGSEKLLLYAEDTFGNETVAEVGLSGVIAQERLARENELLAAQEAQLRGAREAAEKERVAREFAGREKARAAALAAERERLAAEQMAMTKAAAGKAELERQAREKAAHEALALAEKERLARENAEKERAARAEAERARVASAAVEKAERERIAREGAEQERVLRAKAEKERLAQEQAEQERLAKLAKERAREAAQRPAPSPEKTAVIVEREKLKAITNEQKLSLALSTDSEKQLTPGIILGGAGTQVFNPAVNAAAGVAAASGTRPAAPVTEPERCRTPDLEKPILNLKDPGAVPFVFVDAYPLDGMVTDDCSVERVVVNGREVPTRKGKQVYFSSIVKLDSGDNRIQVEVYDGAGNKSTSQMQVTRKIPSVLQNGSRMSVLVLPFDYEPGSSASVRLASDHLVGAMTEQHRFLVVERQKLKALMAERKLSLALAEDNDKAAQFGKIAAAEAIIVNTARETGNSFEVTSRVVDTETSEVLSVLDVYTEDTSPESVRNLMAALAAKIARSFPVVEGIVISRKDDKVLTDLGAPQKVRQRTGAIVYRKGEEIRHPTTGKSLGFDTEKLGEGYLDEVQETFSKLRLADRYRGARGIEPSDLVVTK